MAPRGRPPKTQAQTQQMNSPLPAAHVNTTPIMKTRATKLVVRRSRRLNSPTQVDSEEPVVEDIIVPENEKDQTLNRGNNLSDATKDTPAAQPSPVEVTGMANLNYKTMYINSQKKIRILMKKNKRLTKELKFALGKIEGYAEMTPILSSLSKANETLCNRPWNVRRWRS